MKRHELRTVGDKPLKNLRNGNGGPFVSATIRGNRGGTAKKMVPLSKNIYGFTADSQLQSFPSSPQTKVLRGWKWMIRIPSSPILSFTTSNSLESAFIVTSASR